MSRKYRNFLLIGLLVYGVTPKSVAAISAEAPQHFSTTAPVLKAVNAQRQVENDKSSQPRQPKAGGWRSYARILLPVGGAAIVAIGGLYLRSKKTVPQNGPGVPSGSQDDDEMIQNLDGEPLPNGGEKALQTGYHSSWNANQLVWGQGKFRTDLEKINGPLQYVFGPITELMIQGAEPQNIDNKWAITYLFRWLNVKDTGLLFSEMLRRPSPLPSMEIVLSATLEKTMTSERIIEDVAAYMYHHEKAFKAGLLSSPILLTEEQSLYSDFDIFYDRNIMQLLPAFNDIVLNVGPEFVTKYLNIFKGKAYDFSAIPEKSAVLDQLHKQVVEIIKQHGLNRPEIRNNSEIKQAAIQKAELQPAFQVTTISG